MRPRSRSAAASERREARCRVDRVPRADARTRAGRRREVFDWRSAAAPLGHAATSRGAVVSRRLTSPTTGPTGSTLGHAGGQRRPYLARVSSVHRRRDTSAAAAVAGPVRRVAVFRSVDRTALPTAARTSSTPTSTMPPRRRSPCGYPRGERADRPRPVLPRTSADVTRRSEESMVARSDHELSPLSA